jgi:MFS family permease
MSGSADTEVLRRLMVIGCTAVFLDSTFFSVVTPLLPHYADEFGLSKAEVGLLAGSAAAGGLLAALPSGMLAVRVGVRATVVTALCLLAASSFVFGFGESVAVLEGARFVQGIAGSFIWAAAFAWIADASPAERRGELFGRMLAASFAGTLLGPVIGAIAVSVGTEPVFASVTAGCLIGAAAARRQPAPVRHEAQGLRVLAQSLRVPQVALGAWLVTLTGTTFGMISVLGPLRLDEFGAGAGAIALVFVTVAVSQAIAAQYVGRLSDRSGPWAPIRLGLPLAAAALSTFTLPSSVALLGAWIIAVICGSALFWTPAMAMVSAAATRTGLQQGLIFALMNLTWTAGHMSGSGGAAALAEGAGDGVPTGIMAALMAGTLGAVIIARRRNRLSDRVPVV